MVLLGGLDLVTCTETIETVSISGSFNLKKNPNYANDTIVAQYSRRDKNDPELANLTLHQYFHHKKGQNKYKKTIIPHYVGGSSQPTYPPTEAYARSVLIIHKPWHTSDRDDRTRTSFVKEFKEFLDHPDCPKEVTIPYERVKARVIDKKTHIEPVGEEITIRDVPASDPDTQELLDICATLRADANPEDAFSSYSFDRGRDFDWGRRRFPVSSRATAVITIVCVA